MSNNNPGKQEVLAMLAGGKYRRLDTPVRRSYAPPAQRPTAARLAALAARAAAGLPLFADAA